MKNALITALVGWVVLLSGFGPLQERLFRADPDDSTIIQEVMDEAGVSVTHKILLERLERTLSKRPVIRDFSRVAGADGPHHCTILARFLTSTYFQDMRSRGPPVRIA